MSKKQNPITESDLDRVMKERMRDISIFEIAQKKQERPKFDDKKDGLPAYSNAVQVFLEKHKKI